MDKDLREAAEALSRTVFVNRALQVEAFGTSFADALADLRRALGYTVTEDGFPSYDS